MDEKKIVEYEKIIEAFSSYKLDFLRVKAEGYLLPIIVLSIIGIGIMIWGYTIHDPIVGSGVMLWGAFFFLKGTAPRFMVKATKENRACVLKEMHENGRLEWSMMEDYFHSKFKLEDVRETIKPAWIEMFALTQLIAVLLKQGNSAIMILQVLLLLAALYRTYVVTRQTFCPSRRDTLELLLKETKEYLKNNPWKSADT